MPSWVNLPNLMLFGVIVALVILTLVQRLAERAANYIERWRERAFAIAGGAVRWITHLWGLKGEEEEQRRRNSRKVEEEYDRLYAKERRRKPDDEIDEAALREKAEWVAEPEEPTPTVIASHWMRRFIYILFVFVCVVSDFALVATRVSLLFGGKTPDFLKPIFQYLQPITAVLFVTIAALAGMLIEEYTRGLKDMVKLDPDMSPRRRNIHLGLAIAMISLDIMSVIGLAATGAVLEFNGALLETPLLVVTLGTAVLVAIGVYLAWTGLGQGFLALGTLLFGGLIALVAAAVGIILVALLLLLRGLAALNAAIWRRPQPKPGIQARGGLSIFGYGTNGANFAVGLCEQIAKLYSGDRRLWLTGTYTRQAGAAHGERLKETGILDQSPIIVDPNDPRPSQTLVEKIAGHFNTKKEARKPVIWVSYGEDLSACLKDLTHLGRTVKISGAGEKKTETLSVAIKNIDLVVVWIVPRMRPDRQKAIMEELQKWAKATDTSLKTTIVIEQTSDLEHRVGTQYDEVLFRSLASLLFDESAENTGAADVDTSQNTTFLNAVEQLHEAEHWFAGIAATSVGVDTAEGGFDDGIFRGGVGDVQGDYASRRLEQETQTLFNYGEFTTAGTASQQPIQLPGQLVSVVIPVLLKQVPEFKTAVCNWLDEYYINQDQVLVHRTRDASDKGVNISDNTSLAQLRGAHPIHFSVLYGIENYHITEPARVAREARSRTGF